MDKTVELVNLWGAFALQHPGAGIDDFCRHRLIHQRESSNQNKGVLVGGVVPMDINGLLLKIIGRIHKLHVTYTSAAFEGTPLNQLEEFGMLVTINQQRNPKKSEVIYANLMELSSGTDMLNRLKKKGLIREVDDTIDKRSKRVLLTPGGEKAIKQCVDKVLRMARMFLNDMSDDDKQLCVQLLKNVEIKFSSLVQKHKTQPFETTYKEVMGEKDVPVIKRKK